MSTAAVLDLQSLLSPISVDRPSGINLRDVANPAGRALYDEIRGARGLAKHKEKPQIAGDPTAPAGAPEEWRVVLDKSIEAISTKSKDLEIAAYLIEALVRLHGFAGLRDGFALYRGLIGQFWDSVYPPLDEDGAAGRLAGLKGLNGDASRDGALHFPLSRVPLTDGNNASFGLFHYQCAVGMDKLPPERQEERIKAGQVSLKMFEDSAKRTTNSLARNLSEDLAQCVEEFDKLNLDLTERFGHDAPFSSRIREVLQTCVGLIPVAAGPVSAPQAVGGTKPMASKQASPMAQTNAGIQTREEAFDIVLRVANYFRETEPQSPVIFALEQAVRWGKMKLPELLTELISDDSARKGLFKLVGIQPPKEN